MADNSIVIRQPGDGRGLATGGGAGAGVDPGVGHDIRQAEFTAKAFVFDDLPAAFRSSQQDGPVGTGLVLAEKKPRGGELVPADGVVAEPGTIKPLNQREVFASGAKRLSKPRKAHGEVVRRMIGWQAASDRIVVTVADQSLSKRADGKFEPSGQWAIEARTTYPGQATGRTGKVPVDSFATSAGADAGAAPQAGPPEAANPDFEQGFVALSHLPAPVRSSVLARVVLPILFDGSVHQYNFADGKLSHLQVDLLRMDHKTAIAVQAKLEVVPGTTTFKDHWEVRQSVYSLGVAKVEQA